MDVKKRRRRRRRALWLRKKDERVDVPEKEKKSVAKR